MNYKVEENIINLTLKNKIIYITIYEYSKKQDIYQVLPL